MSARRPSSSICSATACSTTASGWAWRGRRPLRTSGLP